MLPISNPANLVLYDGLGRLTSLSESSFGAQDRVYSATYAYNPAGQMISRTNSNDAYGFSGYVNVNRSYVANGLS